MSPAFANPLLDETELYEIVSLPRGWDVRSAGAPAGGELVPAVVAAHQELSGAGSSALVVAWAQVRPGETLRFLVGGSPRFPGVTTESSGLSRILYPPGTVAVRSSERLLSEMFGDLGFWSRCPGVIDVLWRTSDAVTDGSPRFEQYVAHLGDRPFGWLVVAEPLARDVVEAEIARIGAEFPSLRKRETSERDRVDLERAEAWYRDLERARSSGLWNVHVMAGAATEVDARRAAGILCGATDSPGLPVALIPETTTSTFAEAWESPSEVAGASSPFMATSEIVACLARPPGSELPGVRLTPQHTFDVTAEPDSAGGSVTLGTILDRGEGPAGPFPVALASLNRHTFVCGATGSGKSQTTRNLLEQLSRRDEPVPWLVIEPAKAEYARMAGRIAGSSDVYVVRPGDPSQMPGSLNPLEPAHGFPLQSHVDLVRALFLAAFEAHEPFPQVLSMALSRCYERQGWDLALGRPMRGSKRKFTTDDPDEPYSPRYPSLGDLQNTARDVVEHIGYGAEVTADVRGFIDVRIGSLRLGAPGRFFEGGHPLDVEAMLSKNVVFEIEAVTNDQDKAFLMGVVLIRLVEHLRVKFGNSENPVPLRHVTVVEEAHRLLKNVPFDNPARQSVELFASLLAEVRAYGEGLVVAEQIPSKILLDVVKNTALKVMHRLPAQDDRAVVGATMNLTEEQSAYVVAARPGVAAVSADGMDLPVLVRMPGDGEARETSTGARHDCPLEGRRSLLCATACEERPCTVGEMREAEVASTAPPVVLWTELVVAAHVIGLRSPAIAGETLERLRSTAPRTLDCELAFAVDRAVGARYPHLSDFYAPEDFGKHVASVLRSQIAGVRNAEGCLRADHVRWQAGEHRWSDVQSALERLLESAPEAGPHPDTNAWAARGLRLDESSAAGQLEVLKMHPASVQPEWQCVVGDPDLSGLRAACADLVRPPLEVEQLQQVAGRLTTGRDTAYLTKRLVLSLEKATR